VPATKLEKVRAVLARWGEGDFGSPVDIFDPEIVFVMSPGFPDEGAYYGLEAVQEYTRGFIEPWVRVTIEPLDLVESGDSVVAEVRQHGVGSGSGVETELVYWQVWSFRGDKVIRWQNFRTRADAFGAVGLNETASP
jgi:ketosteroid isomerase-like protein